MKRPRSDQFGPAWATKKKYQWLTYKKSKAVEKKNYPSYNV